MKGEETGTAIAEFEFTPWLDPDEALVWKGAPASAAKISVGKMHVAGAYVFGWAFAMAITYALATSGLELLEKAPDWRNYRIGFGVALIIASVVPLYVAAGITKSELARSTGVDFERYALTEKRALAAYLVKGQYLVKSVPISAADWIGSSFGQKGRILFSRLGLELSEGGELVPEEQIVEFRDIPDAQEVYRLIRAIQNKVVA